MPEIAEIPDTSPVQPVTFYCRYKEAQVEYTKTKRVLGEVVKPGKFLEFERGQATTVDPVAIAFVRSMPEFGTTIYERSADDDAVPPKAKEKRKVGRRA